MTAKMYKKLYPAQIIASLAPVISVIVGGLIVGNFFPASALALIGLVSPVNSFIAALTLLLSIGANVVSGYYVGKGEYKKVNAVYTTVMLVASVVAITLTLLFIAFSRKTLGMFGVPPELINETVPYFIALIIGMLPNILNPVLIVFINLGNHYHFSTVTAIIIAVSNLLFSLGLIFGVGKDVAYIGIANSLSAFVGFALLLTKILKHKEIVEFDLKSFDIKLIGRVCRYGGAVALQGAIVGIRLILMNTASMYIAGVAAVSAMSVQNMINGFAWIIVAEALTVNRFLSGISIGEEDKNGLECIMKTCIKIGIPAVVTTVIILSVFAPQIVSIFGVSGLEYKYTVMFVRAYSLALIFELIYNDLADVYHLALGRIKFVSVINVMAALVFPYIACALGKHFMRLEFVALVYFIAAFSSSLILVVVSVIKNRHLPRRLTDLLFLDSRFDSNDGQRTSISVRTKEEAMTVAEKIMKFCEEKGIDERRRYYAGLCLEEMTMNIINEGFESNSVKNGSIDIFVYISDEKIRIRLRDNAPKFNPIERMDLYKVNENDPFANIGIRIVAGIAKEMSYKTTFNTNVLNIVL